MGAVTVTGTAEAAGGCVAAGVAAPGLAVAAGTGIGVAGTTGAAVTAGTAGVATAAGVAMGTAAPVTGAGVAAGLAAAVATGTDTGVAGGTGVCRGARSVELAIVVGEVTAEAVAGVMLRDGGGGEGLALLPMPKVFRRPPKKSSGGKAGIMPGCALIG